MKWWNANGNYKKQRYIDLPQVYKNSTGLHVAYITVQPITTVQPQATRWNTMSDYLKAYINNWPILMKICEVNREAIDTEVRNKVSNLGLKRSAEELLDWLQPITKTLDEVQSDKCTIAEAVDVWKKLLGHFTNNKQAEKLVKKVWTLYHQSSHACQQASSSTSRKNTQCRRGECYYGIC